MSARLDLPSYPNGWFAIAFAAEIAKGGVLPRKHFGEELVLWRGEDGLVRLNGAHCPHLGAHLGHGGCVERDSIRCPFHGWRFDASGECVEVPYSDRIPRAARLVSWPVREQDGVILAWHDSEGRAPSWEMPRFEREGWTEDTTGSWTIRSHPQEVCENSVDVAHFRYVHRSALMRLGSEIAIDGPLLRVTVEPDPADPRQGVPLDSMVHGPGLVLAEAHQPGFSGRYRLYVTPIDEESSLLRGLVSVRAAGDTAAVHEAMSRAVFAQWEADVPIWEHKTYRANALLAGGEQGIPVFRRFYRQFYAKDAATA